MKTALATVAGLVVGVLVIVIVETIGHLVFPPPEGVDLKDPAQLEAIMHSIPVGAKLSVLIAWGLGMFAGGAVGVLLSGRNKLPATIIAGLLLAGAAYTMFMIPHPTWMIGGALLATGLGWFGATRFARS